MSTMKHHSIASVLFGLLVLVSSSFATIHQVPQEYSTIQSALNDAVTGDTVLVDEGAYVENISFKGKDIVLGSMFMMDNDMSHIRNTIIDGSQPADSNYGSVVRFINGEGPDAQLIGFTLTGGIGTKMKDQWSEAVFHEGGGIIVENSAPTIKFNWIVQNKIAPPVRRQGGGGGIRAGYSEPTITNNVIAYNQGQYGMALVLNVTSAYAANNIMVHNYGGVFYGAGGVWVWGAGLRYTNHFDNNVLMYNRINPDYEDYSGYNVESAGIFNQDGSIIGEGNILYGNDLADAGNLAGAGGFTKMNYSVIGVGSVSGLNQKRQMPEFADEDLHLADGSALIDAADPASEYEDPESATEPGQAMWPALGGVRGDIGAYGGPLASELPTNGLMLLSVGDEVVTSLPEDFQLGAVYPNPFNASTKIRFNLQKNQRVALTVYDVMGRRIQVLQQGQISAGDHEISWSPGNIPSGVYFVRLEGASHQATKRIVLLK